MTTKEKHPEPSPVAKNENDIRTARENNKPGESTPVYGSINEPPPEAPKPFSVPENPGPEPTHEKPPHGDPPQRGHASHPADPDKLEERLEEARDDGDYSTRSTRHTPPPPGRRK